MRYRGFNINCTPSDNDVLCEVFAGNDDLCENLLYEFTLYPKINISDDSKESVENAVIEYVNEYYDTIVERQDEDISNRNADLLGRAVCWIGEFQSGEELYNTLTENIGLTDDEIRELGFTSLAPYFDRDGYAQTIAEYLIDNGTEFTHTGNWHFDFSEINKTFGVSLPSDTEMLKAIVDELDRNIVADIDTTEDFDLDFYLKYCPNCEGEAITHSM